MSLLRRLAHRSVPRLLRTAAALSLVGLAIMAYSIVSPRPLPVVLAMSVGHVVGAVAVLFYLLAIVVDSTRRPPSPTVIALSTELPSEPASPPSGTPRR